MCHCCAQFPFVYTTATLARQSVGFSPLATASQFVADIGTMAGNIPAPLTVQANGDITLPGGITLTRNCQVTFAAVGATIPDTITEEVLGHDNDERSAMNSSGVTPEDVEQGRQAAMEQRRRMAFEVNRRIQQSTKEDVNMDNDVNMDPDVNMDDRTIVTRIPPSTETPLPRANSESSMDSDSTSDRGQIIIVEQMMFKTVANPHCSPFVLDRLNRAHYMETMPMSYYKSSTQFLEMLTHMVTTPTINN
eukprot:6470847-Amphidinium_carterae.3